MYRRNWSSQLIVQITPKWSYITVHDKTQTILAQIRYPSCPSSGDGTCASSSPVNCVDCIGYGLYADGKIDQTEYERCSVDGEIISPSTIIFIGLTMRTISRLNRHTHRRMNTIMHRTIVVVLLGLLILLLKKRLVPRRGARRRFSVLDRIPSQIRYMHDLVDVSDEDCRDQLRMDRSTFHKLCFLLHSHCGLKSSRNVTIAEKVAMFISILAHHTKNRSVKFQFKRSGQTVSKHFHVVLHCVLRLHSMFLVRPTAVTDDEGCLGALDGTYVDVHAPTIDKGRYRNRKGQVSVNVLGGL
ncbi:hypothetical protein ACS0TY_001207 [Phlomoides rotata]